MKPKDRFFSGLLACVLWAGMSLPAFAQKELSLEQAVSIAQESDPWLLGSHHREQATEAQSVAASQLPDPVASVEFANLPVDSFDFGREPMTQFRIGVHQSFPRGNTRALKRKQLREMSARHPYMRQDRRAKVSVFVSQLWLEVFRNREAIRLIEGNRALFGYLVDVAQSSYSSAFGKTRQQDLVRAQLELIRLEDRLTVLQQQREMMRARLNEWLPDGPSNDLAIATHLPELPLAKQGLVDSGLVRDGRVNAERLMPALLAHPMMQSLEQQIASSGAGVRLARQKYKPQWGLNASYGYREDDPIGADRSDLFSIGVTFDLPLFTSRRQDKEVQAAVATAEAIKTDKALALRSMRSRLETALARLRRLNQRKALYEGRLLEKIHEQAEASLTAYTNDDGDFSEVVRARIAELNADIDFLNITIDRLKAIAELNYFFVPANAGHAEGLAP